MATHASDILATFEGPLDLAELGCGSGTKLVTLLEHGAASVLRVQLIDLSVAALEMAQAQVAPLVLDVVALAGSYEDGLARVPANRDGKRHALSVKVKRPHVDVRARTSYVAPGPAR